MRKRLKLSFATLEESLTLISPLEASYVLGGNPEGSALEPGASFDETISYFGSLGFSFTTDPNGNYTFTSGGTYQGEGIPLNEVVINGVRLTRADDDGSENRFSSGIQAMLNRFLDDRTQGSGTVEDGSDGSDGSAPIIVDGGGGGGEGGNPSGGTTPVDPWKKDANGKIIATPNGKTTEINYGPNNYTVYFREVEIASSDGVKVTALEVTGVRYNVTNEMLPTIPEQFKSNCSGYAFSDGQYWLTDPGASAHNEMIPFESMLNNNSLYTSQSSPQNADVAVIWWTETATGSRFIAHSAVVTSDGKYNQKSDYGSVQTGQTYEQFTAGHIPVSEHTYEIIYYKKNF